MSKLKVYVFKKLLKDWSFKFCTGPWTSLSSGPDRERVQDRSSKNTSRILLLLVKMLRRSRGILVFPLFGTGSVFQSCNFPLAWYWMGVAFSCNALLYIILENINVTKDYDVIVPSFGTALHCVCFMVKVSFHEIKFNDVPITINDNSFQSEFALLPTVRHNYS